MLFFSESRLHECAASCKRYESGTSNVDVTALNHEHRMSPAKQRKSSRTSTASQATDHEVALQTGDDQPAGRGAQTSNASSDGVDALDMDGRIRRRAYEIYLSRDGQAGNELDDWLAAESEVRIDEDPLTS